MAITSLPTGMGKVRGAVIRARTLTQGVFDIVVAERGIVLVPLWGQVAKPRAFLLGGFQGGIIGHRRGGDYDARRRESYECTSADELARHYLSYQTVRRQDVAKAQIWDHEGNGKLRLELNDGTSFVFRWEKKANRGLDAASLLFAALGPALEVRRAGPAFAAEGRRKRASAAAEQMLPAARRKRSA
jgi:hypothetical protein